MTKRTSPIGNDGIRSILSQIDRLKEKTKRTKAVGRKIGKESTIKGYSEEIGYLTKGLIVRIRATIRETKEAIEVARLEEIISLIAKGETKIKV